MLGHGGGEFVQGGGVLLVVETGQESLARPEIGSAVPQDRTQRLEGLLVAWLDLGHGERRHRPIPEAILLRHIDRLELLIQELLHHPAQVPEVHRGAQNENPVPEDLPVRGHLGSFDHTDGETAVHQGLTEVVGDGPSVVGHGRRARHGVDILGYELADRLVGDADRVDNQHVTDFGLAKIEREIRKEEVLAGTPSYMAPEQLAGESVSVQSDLYALGLVLYELFTGHRPWKSEIERLQRESSPTWPSSHIEDLDPAVERVILRCLEPDPRDRPASAMAIAAVLPGGDALAAAMAAGETPAPELVAEAGASGVLTPAVAWSLLGALAVGLAITVWLSADAQLSRVVPMDEPPQVLARRARDLLAGLNHGEEPADSVSGFARIPGYLSFLRQRRDSSLSLRQLSLGRPSAYVFWYVDGPAPLVPYDLRLPPRVKDPPLVTRGMRRVVLDTTGRLLELAVVSPTARQPGQASPEPDWAPLFDAAGLELASFSPVRPSRTPLVNTDRRAAWEGAYPGPLGLQVRVEAGAFGNAPVYFAITWPWSMREGFDPRQDAWSTSEGQTPSADRGAPLSPLAVGWLVIALGGGVVVARRNLRLGRGDRTGANRLALYVVIVGLVSWIFGTHHVGTADEIRLFVAGSGWILWIAACVWVSYLAIEPHFRRFWPRSLVSWMRLLKGRFRDPLVGRDVLIGCVYGTFAVVLAQLYQLMPGWLGTDAPLPPDRLPGPPNLSMAPSTGPGEFLYELVFLQFIHLFGTFLGLLGLVLLRLLLRRGWAAIVAAFTLATFAMNMSSGQFFLWGLLVTAVSLSVAYALLFRVGLVPVLIGQYLSSVLLTSPLTFDYSEWYAPMTVMALLLVGLLAVYGCWVSVGGRPLPASAASTG